MESAASGPSSFQPETPPLDIYLLGRFQVFRGGELIPDSAWTRRKARALFKLLTLSPNRCCHKEQLLDLLWPKLDAAAAANNLHKILYFLRRILCPGARYARQCPYVEFDGEMVSLTPHLVSRVDVDQFETQAAKALVSTEPRLYTTALDLYAGDLLPEDLYEDWAIPRRRALRQTYLSLLHQLGELYLDRREYEAASVTWRRLLTAEPTDEEAHRKLMRAYALAGKRHQALRQYHLCCQVLADELNLEPLPETVALYQAVLAGEIVPDPTVILSLPLPPARYRLVGREPEMKALLVTLNQIAESGPHLAIIFGQAGVGKTRLAQEVARQADARNLAVLLGSTYEPVGTLSELPLPYGPLVEALRRFLADQPVEVRQQLVGPWQADLARLLPELEGESPPPRLEPELARRCLFDAVAHFLGTITATQPLLLILDDLHAADQATFELMSYLLHRSPPIQMLVLALAREEGAQPIQTPLTHLLARMERRGAFTRLWLSPFTPAETAQLVHDRLPGRVDEAVTWAIHESSEGNPLFAEQLLQAWQEEGVIVAQDERWLLRFQEQPLPLPPSLRETISLRLARLSVAAQEMLALTAVAGRECRYRWLKETGSWDEPTLLNLLDEALQARVLEEVIQPSGPLRYRFQHGLIRQTLYQDLSVARQRHLHRQLARVLEELEKVPESVLSHHWFAAGYWPQAFSYALSAAEQALHAFANAEAVSLYERALAAARGNWQPDAERLARVHTGRAQALMGLNRFGEAVTDWEWLVEKARAIGDRAAEGQALSRLSTAYFWDHNLDTARRYAQEALDIVEETGDVVSATMCTSNLGCIALCTGHLVDGARHLEAVLQQSRTLGQLGLLVETLACLPGAYHWQGDSARSLPLLEEGIALARQEGLGFWLGNLLFFAGLARGALGHYEQALNCFRQAQRHSQEAGDLFTAVRVVNCLGWIHYELYDTATAFRYDRQAVESARNFPWPEPLANALVNLGFDSLQVGELVKAERCFAEATDLLARDDWMRWRWHTRLLVGQGRLALARQELDQAEVHARQALALAEKTAACKNQARAYLLLGEIGLTANEAKNAALFLRQAAALAQAVNNPHLQWLSMNALGRAAFAQGNDLAAVEVWSQAAQVVRAIAADLTDKDLRRTFLSAGAVQVVLGRETERPA